MSYVFDKIELIKALNNYGIKSSLKTDKDIDNALTELAIKRCNSNNFIGSGIARSTFDCGDYILKVSKEFYVDEYDENAEQEYIDNMSEEEYEAYENGELDGYSFNCIESIPSSQYADEQSYTEIENYKIINKLGRVKNQFYKIFAATSNCAIILAEKCSLALNRNEHWYEIYGNLSEVYNDIHQDNIGLNKDNKVVILDIGMEGDWDRIARTFNVIPEGEI